MFNINQIKAPLYLARQAGSTLKTAILKVLSACLVTYLSKGVRDLSEGVGDLSEGVGDLSEGVRYLAEGVGTCPSTPCS
jgi:X-X-X-Leu-X-X-Gly heptad repeat protein